MNEIYNKAFCNVRLRKREAFYFCLFVGEYLFCYREKKEPPGLLSTIATFKSPAEEEEETEKMKQVSSLITVFFFFFFLIFVWLHQVLLVVHRIFNGHSSMWGL